MGLSLLSGDASSATGPPAVASFYDSGKGILAHAFTGRHLRHYFSVQGAFVWTRNRIRIDTVRASGQALSVDDELSQTQAAADFLLYFRDRGSWARPFLSVGAGVSSFAEARGGSTRSPALRVAAGLDLIHGSGWGFRYAFLETVSRNPASRRLTPPGRKSLMTFQNLFGLVKYF